MTRRRALAAAAGAAALPLVHIRSAGAAGKLSLALWDHWVPGGNAAMKKLVDAWAEKNKVDVQLDFLTAIGFKINITMSAEAQARTGHDVYAFDMWTVHEFADKLDPVDDVVGKLSAKYGKVSKAVEYLGKVDGHWMAVPVGWGSSPLSACARISMFQKYGNVDVRKWYPDHESNPQAAADWTYDTQLRIAEAAAKDGHPFGLGTGTTTDSCQTWGAIFGAFGADLIDAKGNVTVDSENVRKALEYGQKLVKYLSPDTVSFDDASNNRALISGKAAMIWNPPSGWAVAKRDAPKIAEDCWTFPNPKGPKGRLVPLRPYFWGIWQFAQNKSAAKELITWLSEREQVEVLEQAVVGYDIPPFLSMSDLKVWSEVEPPKGTVYNYPIRPWHDAEYYITGSSAPPEIAVQMWNRGTIPTMVAKLVAGQSIDQSIAWAKDELAGFIR
ncbi:MAG: ABC transporter substrate-binding protein [Rhodospirillales bacterium 69-11]|nr:MAG: ABC transporter substrate-binding protein [Rhodospirillales bacterium 69-11]